MKETDCSKCFHFGKSPVTGMEGCAIEHKREVCPGKCFDFVPIPEVSR